MAIKDHDIRDDVPELARVSSKGQIVIPQDIRKSLHIREGSVFAVSAPKKDLLLLKRIENPVLQEDLAILKEVEEAWKEIERGECSTYSPDEFFKKFKPR